MRAAEQLRYLILAAQREGNRQLAAQLARVGLTPAQSEALRIIGEHGPLSLGALGDMLVCDTGASPSRIVERLVAVGLVERTPSTQDRRQVTLTLTGAGENAAGHVKDIESRFYDTLDAATEDLDADALVAFLQRLTQHSAGGKALANRIAAAKGAAS